MWKVLLRYTFCFVILFLYLLAFFINAGWFFTSEGSHDFGSFIAAGQFAEKGENPYSAKSDYIFSVIFPRIGIAGIAPNLNPPITVLIFQWLAKYPPETALNVWRIVTVFFFAISLSVLLYLNDGSAKFPIMKVIWATGLASFWHTLQLGQMYTFLLFVMTMAYFLSQRDKKHWAGIALGILAAIKPNFILLLLMFWAARSFKIVLYAGATILVLSTIPLFIYGSNIYFQWFSASSFYSPNLLIFPGNNSLIGLFSRYGQPELGTGIAVVLLIFSVFVVRRYKLEHEIIFNLGILVSLFCSPIAWTGYTMLLLPMFFYEKKWGVMLFLAAIIFSVPFSIILNRFELSFANFVFWGWFYGWGMLALLFDLYKKILGAKLKVCA